MMELSDLVKLIKGRRSIRRWQDKEVPEELLIKAVELATWAPNAGNQQNWRFYIIKNGETIRAIADALQSSVDQMASWPEADAFKKEVDGWRQRACFFRSAPAAIAVAAGQYQALADKILILREKSDAQAKGDTQVAQHSQQSPSNRCLGNSLLAPGIARDGTGSRMDDRSHAN